MMHASTTTMIPTPAPSFLKSMLLAFLTITACTLGLGMLWAQSDLDAPATTTASAQ